MTYFLLETRLGHHLKTAEALAKAMPWAHHDRVTGPYDIIITVPEDEKVDKSIEILKNVSGVTRSVRCDTYPIFK